MTRKKNPRSCALCGKKFQRNSDFIALWSDENNCVEYYHPECYQRRNRMAKGVKTR